MPGGQTRSCQWSAWRFRASAGWPVGDLLAFLASLCWTASNVAIARGSGGKGDDNGAFLSILLTAGLASVVWLAGAWGRGWPVLVPASVAWFMLGGALTMFIGRVLSFSSIQRLGAIRGASIKRLVPLFSVLCGVVLLGDALSVSLVIGMLLIFGGFGVLVVESLGRVRVAVQGAATAAHDSDKRRWMRVGLLIGAVSALAYALGNVARKFGLNLMPEPAFGAMLGALTGVLLFLLSALFAPGYRASVRSTFTRFNPWLFGAGLSASAGQLLFFVAIDYTTVSRAALIVSLEVFLTMGMTRVLLPGRESLSMPAVVAAVLGVVGTVVIMLG
jgi:drug/metabolite transporter (DMT)-like permease